jgi:serine phosphatase RsbU (regulator of sigma subunit)
MANHDIPAYLRLHREEEADGASAAPESDGKYGALLTAFQEVTGWSLTITSAPAQVAEGTLDSGVERAPLVSLNPPTAESEQGADRRPVELYRARQLANAVAGVVDDLHAARDELWRREADLAAGVPVTTGAREEEHLAERLEAVLKGGAQAVGGQAAAVYLLDDATTELKLRAAWGLPKERFLDEPRPLRGAVADLEALVGHAVVLEDAQLLPHWKVPEPYASAVCVPISSPSEPLGTLWVFCDQPREFTPEQTNLVEIIAGRVAAELQREVLLRECVQNKGLEQQLRRAAEWQNNRLPCIAPLLDDWELVGWSHHEQVLNRGFYDWYVPADGSLAVAVGGADGVMLESALTAAVLHAAVRSHGDYRHQADQMLNRVNETFWNSSAGGQFASLFYALINPDTGELQCACAGAMEIVMLRKSGPEIIQLQLPPLGSQPEDIYPSRPLQIDHGEMLIVLGDADATRPTDQRRQFRQDLVAALQDCDGDSPRELLEQITNWLATCESGRQDTQGSVLVVHRK